MQIKWTQGHEDGTESGNRFSQDEMSNLLKDVKGLLFYAYSDMLVWRVFITNILIKASLSKFTKPSISKPNPAWTHLARYSLETNLSTAPQCRRTP